MERDRLSTFYVKLKLANKRAAIEDKDETSQGSAKRPIPLPPDANNPSPVEIQWSPARQSTDYDTNSDDYDYRAPDEFGDGAESGSDSSYSNDDHSPKVNPSRDAHKDGWTAADICALMLYTAKSNGVTNSTLDKFLKVMALVVNGRRCTEDGQRGKRFPASVRSVKRLLKISHEEKQKVIYICPTKRTVRKKGDDVPTAEICGFTLRSHDNAARKTHICDMCEAEWDHKIVERDGNHFVVANLHWILSTVLERYGKKIGTAAIAGSVAELMFDVKDGRRWKGMLLEGTDLVISVHADGAAISNSTNRKMYLVFIHLLNLPVGVRQNIWPLFLVWVGEALPKDREAFLLELSLQLNSLQSDYPDHQTVRWTDKDGKKMESSTYVHSVYCDTPERAALNGQFSHAAAQGCIYCTQVAECLDHVMCYRYKDNPALKSHKKIMHLSEKWNTLSLAEQKQIHEDRTGEGFKRPSLLRHWKKFDMVEGFAQDVMHQMDEGLSRGFLKAIVEGSNDMKLTKNQINEIDRRWLQIVVPGHDNRKLRSVRTFKLWKAHELRFFLLHGGPFVTRGVITDIFHRILCLASSIAWTCTKDSVSSNDIELVEEWSIKFLKKFQKYFGVRAMKYSVHLVQHIPLALRLFGPLHLVSCYRPENEIGKISRRICGTNNTTKQIMSSFLTLTECDNYLCDVIAAGEDRDSLLVKTVFQVKNLPLSVFFTTSEEGMCRLLGKPEVLSDENELQLLKKRPELRNKHHSTFYSFKKARVEVGINVRTRMHNESSVRNESVVQDKDGNVWKLIDFIAVLSEDSPHVQHSYVYAEKMVKVYSNLAEVAHISNVKQSEFRKIFPTVDIRKHLVILMKKDGERQLTVSSPSNIYLVT